MFGDLTGGEKWAFVDVVARVKVEHAVYVGRCGLRAEK